MIRRISLVRRREDLTRAEFLARWTGEHAEIASQLAGLRGYVIYVPTDESSSFDGIAVTSFDTVEAAQDAFANAAIAEGLRRTRDEFAASVEVHFVEEHVVVKERA